ncbi:uncharacterized protein K441DRAFT_613561 [Cenococcum geophilum 1.58]|uniref:uncharacterized protein n=1 Tax=Cenococcum geophilum 1.58 TaxID=794803 RepID=UPI00358FBB7F|nr:hypothetical protein K441DRAFT_613561 [Cenococcum geophilum 1.58]
MGLFSREKSAARRTNGQAKPRLGFGWLIGGSRKKSQKEDPALGLSVPGPNEDSVDLRPERFRNDLAASDRHAKDIGTEAPSTTKRSFPDMSTTAGRAPKTTNEPIPSNPNPTSTLERVHVPPLTQSDAEYHKYLWDKAFFRLRNKEKELMKTYDGILAKSAGIPEGLSQKEKMSAVITKELRIMTNKKWTVQIPWKDKPMAVRSVVDKIVRVVLKFKEVGSVAASTDPIHAGLPFAGICVLLPLITNDSQEHEKALKGLEEITDLIGLYTKIENVYLKQDGGIFMRNFIEKLEHLYFEILLFLAIAARYFDLNTIERIARNIPRIDDWDSQLQAIRTSDKTFRKFANEFRSQEQRTGMETIKDLVEQQLRATNDLLQEFKLQSDQSRNIISWVSNVDVEADHNRVREKLGSQYQNSGQWLRSWYDEWIASTDKPNFWLCGSVGTGKSSLV